MKTGFKFKAVPIKYKTGSIRMYDSYHSSMSDQCYTTHSYIFEYIKKKMLSDYKISKECRPISAYRYIQTNIRTYTNERIDE